MKFSIYRTSGENPTSLATRDEDGGWEVEINTLEDLLRLVDVEDDIIIHGSYSIGNGIVPPRIEIYDDYRE